LDQFIEFVDVDYDHIEKNKIMTKNCEFKNRKVAHQKLARFNKEKNENSKL